MVRQQIFFWETSGTSPVTTSALRLDQQSVCDPAEASWSGNDFERPSNSPPVPVLIWSSACRATRPTAQ
jgi:hypothetical protein